MKRLLFISLIACLVSVSAFAAETNFPNPLNSFYKTFQNAQNVSWTEVDDMLRIGFTMSGHQRFAYYLNDELVVVATEIKVEELPEALKTQLSGYKEYIISQIYELSKDNVKEYCVVLDNSLKHLVLKGSNKLRICTEEKK